MHCHYIYVSSVVIPRVLLSTKCVIGPVFVPMALVRHTGSTSHWVEAGLTIALGTHWINIILG